MRLWHRLALQSRFTCRQCRSWRCRCSCNLNRTGAIGQFQACLACIFRLPWRSIYFAFSLPKKGGWICAACMLSVDWKAESKKCCFGNSHTCFFLSSILATVTWRVLWEPCIIHVLLLCIGWPVVFWCCTCLCLILLALSCYAFSHPSLGIFGSEFILPLCECMWLLAKIQSSLKNCMFAVLWVSNDSNDRGPSLCCGWLACSLVNKITHSRLHKKC